MHELTQGAGHLPRRLSSEDLSILGLENETVAGHTCKVIELEREIDIDALRASITARLDGAPELSLCLREIDGEAWWVPADQLDVAAHVVEHTREEPYDQVAFRAAVARLFEARLDRSCPLWRIDVLPRLAAGGSALIWRIHHALADGATAMRMAAAVLWDDGQPGTDNSLARPRPVPAAAPRRRAALRSTAREMPQPWLRSPFDGHIGARREVAFATADLPVLRQVAHAHQSATVNDAVLEIVGGGLRHWLEARHGRLGKVRVKVPVSLHGATQTHGESDDEAGNRDSFFCLDVPIGREDPLGRLDAISRATRVRKQGQDAQHIDALMHQLAGVPRLENFMAKVLTHPRSFALNVSNVPGPRQPVQVLGIPVRALYSLAEIREHHALRVAVISLVDKLGFGLAVDPTLIPDVDLLAAGFQAEAEALADLGANR